MSKLIHSWIGIKALTGSTLLILLIGQRFCDEPRSTQTTYLFLSDTLQLSYGRCLRVADSPLTVGFNRVIGDSRCPLSVHCDWEGMAEIEIWFMPADQDPLFLILPIMGYVNFRDTLSHISIDTLHYRFTLLQLDPYPVYPFRAPYYNYTATIALHYPER